LDGWWAEAYSPVVGWALGDGEDRDTDPAWDAAEAEALYVLLENEVVPAFYTRDEQGIPSAWVARMRESMAQLTPRFSSNRAVREYAEQYYLPAASAYLERAGDQGKIGADIVRWRHALNQNWTALRLGEAKFETHGGLHKFEIQVGLNGLDPEAVRVELYADGVMGGASVRHGTEHVGKAGGSTGGEIYRASVPADRPSTDYTARVIPHCDGVTIPLEDARVLWQR